jgi:hypothetical protein
MRKRVGPFQIVERRNQFEVRHNGTVLSRLNNFLNAEDAALRIWLGPRTMRILKMSYHNPVFLTTEQTALIRTAAASINPSWRQRFLASVEDQLLGHEPDHVSDTDVLAAIDAVRGAFHTLDLNDDD